MQRKTIAHILLIDDEDDCHFVTKLVLRKAGYAGHLTHCPSAADALALLQAGTNVPDLILVDINMPGMNGYEFVTTCEATGLLPNGRSSVVMFSSSNRPQDVEAARSHRSVIGYVEKALTVDQFHRISEQHLHNTRD